LLPLYQILAEPNYSRRYTHISPTHATMEEVLAVHSRFYIDQIREHAVKPDPYSYDRDTCILDQTLEAALLAAGGCTTLADRIMDGTLTRGFALIRPPGHHAEGGRGMGFCVFNNVAITAQHLRKTHGLSRILIVDFDAHHGNGTQEIFYHSNEVLTVSIHQKGLFPSASGETHEIGSDAGRGYALNLPVHPLFGDMEYTFLMGKVLQGVVEQFMPQIILVSAGYDAHADDPISGTLLTTGWYGTVTEMLKNAAKEVCESRLLFVLEGGYNPDTLTASALATIDSLLSDTIRQVGILKVERAARLIENHPIREFWTL
jgi:acetoin utilization deacetylase AcuC-like enzyme